MIVVWITGNFSPGQVSSVSVLNRVALNETVLKS